MPLLPPEPDLHPADLFERPELGREPDRCWWALYTQSRREKELMRQLAARDVAFYGPTVERESRTPKGRKRSAYVPLFSNYVFLYGDESSRHAALRTNCVSRAIPVPDGAQLTEDLRRLRRLIATGAPVTLESQLEPGRPVRIRSGPFKGQEGTVIDRREQKRLVVAVNFLQQGASVLLEEFEVEAVV